MNQSQAIWDATLFPGQLGGRYPMLGRILPFYCYKDGVVAPRPPDRWTMEQHVTQHVVGYNNGVMPDRIYVEEFAQQGQDLSAWNFEQCKDEQFMLDLRAEFMSILRRVVGNSPKLGYYGWPVGGVMQLRAFLNPNYLKQHVEPKIHAAGRARLEIRADVISRSRYVGDFTALNCYWNDDTALYTNASEDEAYWSCCEAMMEIAAASGLEVMVFARIMSQSGKPVPREVVNLYRKFEKLAIWEGDDRWPQGPPKDAPGLVQYGKVAKAA